MQQYQLWHNHTDWRNSIISCIASWKITFGSKRTCHAHERESCDSIRFRRRIQLCYWAHDLCSYSPESRMNLSRKDVSAKIEEFIKLRIPKLKLTVFRGKCVKLSPFSDIFFPTFLKVTSVEVSQDSTIAHYSTRVLTPIAIDGDKQLFRKGTSSVYRKTIMFIVPLWIKVSFNNDDAVP